MLRIHSTTASGVLPSSAAVAMMPGTSVSSIEMLKVAMMVRLSDEPVGARIRDDGECRCPTSCNGGLTEAGCSVQHQLRMDEHQSRLP
jgi:hypothetical protein